MNYMPKILTGIKPKNRLKGRKTLVFIRDNESLSADAVSIPHLYCSRRMSHADAEILRDKLVTFYNERGYLEKDRLTISKPIESGWQRYVIHLRGDRGKIAPYGFVKTSVDEILRLQYPVFSEVEFVDEGIRVASQPSLESIIDLPMFTWDIETDQEFYSKSKAGNVDDEYSRVNTIAFVYETPEGLVSAVKSIFDEDIHNQNQLVKWLSNELTNADPVYLNSHNLAYDLLQPRKLTGEFFPGVDGSEPKISGVISSTGGLVIPDAHGRQLIDSYGFAKGWLWLPNNKLETVSNFFGINFKKGLDYAGVEGTIRGVENGSMSVGEIEKVKDYCLEDAVTHYKLGKRIRPLVSKLAIALETGATQVCFSSKANLAEKLGRKKYFDSLNTLPFRKNKFQGIDVSAKKIELLEKDNTELIRNGKRVINTKPLPRENKFYNEPVMVVYPTFLSNIVVANTKNSNMQKLQNWADCADNPIDKIVLQQGIDTLCIELLYDLESGFSGFFAKHGASNQILAYQLDASANRLRQQLANNNIDIINYSNRFLFLKGNSVDAHRIVKETNDLVLYGVSPNTISLGRRGIIAKVDGNIISPGISIYGRAGKTSFENKTIYAMAKLALNGDLAGARDCLEVRCNLINYGLSRRDLIITTRMGQYMDEYTKRTYGTKRMCALLGLETTPKKGERLSFGYVDINGEPTPLLAEQFLVSNYPISEQWYRNKFFGIKDQSSELSKGTISNIAYTIWPNKKRLIHLFRGNQPTLLDF